MSRTVCHVSILDGYLAGPDQTREDPLGTGGEALHEWHWQADEPGHETDAAMRDDLLRPIGACVMGRNMFGPVRGPWGQDGSEEWRGWWGEDPPYHAPVFVLTHHPHEKIEMLGGTTFFFVTEGFESALRQAQQVAGDLDVRITGGASTIRQALAAGALDELTLDIAPILLGAGERLLDGVTDLGLKPIEATSSPRATHIRYRVGRR